MKHSTRKNLFMLFLSVPGAFIQIFGVFGAISQTIMLALADSLEAPRRLIDAALPFVTSSVAFVMGFVMGFVMMAFSLTLQAAFEPWLFKTFRQMALDFGTKYLALAASCTGLATVILACRERWSSALVCGIAMAALITAARALHRRMLAAAEAR